MSILSVATVTTENATTPLTLSTGNTSGPSFTLYSANTNARISHGLGIGVNPIARLDVSDVSRVRWNTSLSSVFQVATNPASNNYVGMNFDAASYIFQTSGTDRIYIDPSGNMGVGTATPSAVRLDVAGTLSLRGGTTQSSIGWTDLRQGEATRTGWIDFLFANGNSCAYLGYASSAVVDGIQLMGRATYGMVIGSDNTTRLYIDPSGNFFFNQFTTSDPGTSNVDGAVIGNSSGAYISITRNGGTVGNFNRRASDGTIIELRQAGVLEGAISVSGTTVTYGTFTGSHWSQLLDNSRQEILRGTVVETINEKCVWEGEENDQLAKFKVSDTESSPSVYGVFMTWDNDDVENNDAHIVSLGTYIVRIAEGVTVQNGDLLESNGDGCARVQNDTIIRSSTIGKVTSNIPVETYEDGSYLVPCVLYCG